MSINQAGWTERVATMASSTFNFSRSILFGKSGQYTICSIPVTFEKDPIYTGRSLATIVNFCRILFLSRASNFHHEMGHAITIKLLTGQLPYVYIGGGASVTRTSDRIPHSTINNIILAAGPLAQAVFDGIHLNLAASVLPLHKPAAIILSIGALDEMVSSIITMIPGPIRSGGDWSRLFHANPTHFFLAGFAVTGVYALSLYLATRKESLTAKHVKSLFSWLQIGFSKYVERFSMPRAPSDSHNFFGDRAPESHPNSTEPDTAIPVSHAADL